MATTARAQRIIDRARFFGMKAEANDPAVKINGRSMTVSNAEDFVEGWAEGFRAGQEKSQDR